MCAGFKINATGLNLTRFFVSVNAFNWTRLGAKDVGLDRNIPQASGAHSRHAKICDGIGAFEWTIFGIIGNILMRPRL